MVDIANDLIRAAGVLALYHSGHNAQATVKAAREVDTKAIAMAADESDNESLMEVANLVSCVAGMNLDVVTHDMIRETCVLPEAK
jgi:hypothetical protein